MTTTKIENIKIGDMFEIGDVLVEVIGIERFESVNDPAIGLTLEIILSKAKSRSTITGIFPKTLGLNILATSKVGTHAEEVH